MLLENWMEEHFVAVESGLNSPMVRNAPEAAVLLRLGVAAQGMTTGVAARLLDDDLQGGGASVVVAAGLHPEIGEEIGLSPETGTINLQGHSQGLGVDPGQLRESEDPEVKLEQTGEWLLF